jgi:hypothetical protein
MPDWLTHTLVGWITGKTTKLEVSLIVIGALVPDISKIELVFNWIFNKDVLSLFYPIHTPLGAFLIIGILSLFFHDYKKTLLLLGIGVATHFILDLLLMNTSGGMILLFPFSWEQWQLQLIRSDDYLITIAAVIAAFFVYLVYFLYEKQRTLKKTP